jgi:non-specific serine/threonine protein kinase
MASDPAAGGAVPPRLRPLPPRDSVAPVGLPVPVAPLIGRERETTELAALLTESGARLVTLTGPGGVGKTRLAVEVAVALNDSFRAGAVFVPLAAVPAPPLVAATIARALGVRHVGDRPATAVLIDALRGRELLLTLDNFEHLLEAAPLLIELLTASPDLRILVTSRSRLRLSGERSVPISPLALPDQDGLPSLAELPAYGAIRLWVERAQAAHPDFALSAANAADVVAVCHRLDGLPLAIELAAAWSRLLSPAAILARLDRRLEVLTGGPRDQPARLQTMTNAIAWSHDLLTPDQQRLFRRLAVFVGGFSLAAAAAVAGRDEAGWQGAVPSPEDRADDVGPGHPVFDGIAALADQQLLVRSDPVGPAGSAAAPRFGMLETVREFGLAQLAASGEEGAARDAHAACLLVLAAEAEPRLVGADQVAWLDRLERELPNIRAALGWLREQGRTEEGLRLSAAPGRFWWRRGYLIEGRSYLDAFLALPAVEGASPSRVRALILAGDIAAWQKDNAQALARHGEAALLAQACGDARSLALALYGLGSDAIDRGEPEQAEPLLAESVARFRDLDDAWGVALVRSMQGSVAHARGDYARAVACNEEALAVFRERQDWRFVAGVLDQLGQLALAQGDGRRARRAYDEALALSIALGDKTGIAWSLMGLAGVAALAGRTEAAARLLGAAAALREALGARLGPQEQVLHDRIETRAQAAVEPSTFGTLWEEGAALPLAEAIALATAVADDATGGSAAGERAGTLSPREREVLRLLVEGASDPEIAARLFISRKTASNHVAAILERLGVANRTAAAALAVRRGLV